MTTLLIRPEAEADIDAAAPYYASEENVDLGLRFYDAVDRTFAMLLERPQLGSLQEWLGDRLVGCRRWPLTRPFEVYQVFYTPRDGGIEVIRVLHGARSLPELLG